MTTTNPWDNMSKYFDTSKNDIASGAADNILIAWPVVLKFIHKNSPRTQNKILDYECGGGGFAHKLNSLGNKVIGIDLSEQMIQVAKSTYTEIPFFTGDSSTISSHGSFDIITSIMTLQFIENIDKVFHDFSESLNPNGLLIFAVFNPSYVVEGLQNNKGFTEFDSLTYPRVGIKLFQNGTVRIPVYIRTAEEYNAFGTKHGFKNLLEEYPPFTQEYLITYPSDDTFKSPEYLILGYKKI